MKKLKISSLKLVPEFYPREGVDEERVNEFTELLKEGVKFDPIKVTKESIVLDGIHRLKAHELAGLDEIEVEVVEDAGEFLLLTAASLNSKHGKPLTNTEKRSVVEKVVTAEPDVDLKELADALAVSKITVYRWTEEPRQSQDTHIKQRALELREQSKTEQEIADEMGVPRRTISDWLGENYQMKNIAKSNGTEQQSTTQDDGDLLPTQNSQLSLEDEESRIRRNREGLRECMQEVMKFHEQGKSDDEISQQTGRPVKTVTRWIAQGGKIDDGEVEKEWRRVFQDINERSNVLLEEALREHFKEQAATRKALENDQEWQRRDRAREMLALVIPLLDRYLQCPDHGENELGHRAVEELTFVCGLKFGDAAKKWKEIVDAPKTK